MERKKERKNYILPYRFSALFYFVFKGNFSPGISSWGLIFRGRVTFIANIGRVALVFRTNCMIECNVNCQFSTHIDHVNVSPTDAIGPTQGQRKTLTRVGIEPTTFRFDHRCPTDCGTIYLQGQTVAGVAIEDWFNSHTGQSFPLSLCGPNSISRANTHVVYMGRKLALHITLYHSIYNWRGLFLEFYGS